MFDLAFLSGKQAGKEGLRLTVVRYVFVLLLGLVCGFVLQSTTGLVRAVDNFSGSSGSASISVDGQGVSYAR